MGQLNLYPWFKRAKNRRYKVISSDAPHAELEKFLQATTIKAFFPLEGKTKPIIRFVVGIGK